MSSLSQLRADLARCKTVTGLRSVFGPQEPAPVIVALDPLTLPLMQQAALMQMNESHFRRAVVTAMLEGSQDKPTLPDYHALVALGLATKRPNDKWHRLTVEGVIAAKALEPHLCRAHDVHAFIGPRGTGRTVSFHCPCGWRTEVRNSPTARGNASVSWNNFHSSERGVARLYAAMKPTQSETA